MMLYIIYYEHNACSVRDAIVFPLFSVFVWTGKTIRIRYVRTRIFLKTEEKLFLFKQKRIRQTQTTLEILKTIPKRVSTYQLN